MKEIQEIVVISGKGGTGKTSVSSALAVIGGSELILADCDVDAPDLHLVTSPVEREREVFYAGELARIDSAKCNGCGKCKAACGFLAINRLGEREYTIDPFRCEGCGYCARICPTAAITNLPRITGEVIISQIKTNTTMVHAHLEIGGENSGKLVAELKNRAKKIAKASKKKIVLVDGSPGIGCPVVSSLSGASLVLLVVEPTVSGFHDLKRVLEVVNKFSLQSVAIINKYDLNENITNQIKEYLGQFQVEVLSYLPYDRAFYDAVMQGKSIVELRDDYQKKFAGIYKKIKEIQEKK